jgi:hypothetical protein
VKESTEALAELFEVLVDGLSDDRLRLRSLYVLRAYLIDSIHTKSLEIGKRARRRLANRLLDMFRGIGPEVFKTDEVERFMTMDISGRLWSLVTPSRCVDSIVFCSEMSSWPAVTVALHTVNDAAQVYGAYREMPSDMERRVTNLMVWAYYNLQTEDQSSLYYKLDAFLLETGDVEEPQ